MKDFCNNLSLTKKIWVLFSGFGLLLVIVGGLAISTAFYQKNIAIDVHNYSDQAKYNMELVNNVTEVTLLAMDIIVDKEEGDVSAERMVELENLIMQIGSVKKGLLSTLDTEEEQKFAKLALTKLEKLITKDIKVSLIEAVRNKSGEEVFAELDDIIDGTATEIKDDLDKITISVKLENIEAYNKQLESFKLVYVMIIIVLTSIVIGFLITMFIGNNIGKMGKNMIESVANLSDLISQISVGNQDLSSRTQDQASSLQETAATLEEFTATIKSTANNAEVVSDVTNSAVKAVSEGKDLSESVSHAMGEIQKSSEKIPDIVNLVDEIAFQTNILAINAAIEAAKAGELGKGFAVVAIEVRDLAQRSADAAKEIKNLITESISRVDAGVDKVGASRLKLDDINEFINKVSSVIAEVNISTKEQSSAIGQINIAVEQLDNVTQQNAGLVEEVASSSEKVSHNSEELSDIIKMNLS